MRGITAHSLAAFVLLSPVFIGSTGATETAGKRNLVPISVSANKVSYNQKQQLAVYTGQVRITQGTIRFQADRARTRGSNGPRPQRILAWGAPLTVSDKSGEKSVHIEASEADYNTDSSMLVLTGRVRINYDGDVFESERLFYHPPSGRLWSSEQGNAGKSTPVTAIIKRKSAPGNTP
ncbi:MAG: lipopolysaccharide transport periplasmic protein LptA [Gammaproteobacteria bacterium]|nr:lipopolysaccharide transport periplasmic protein LptA [Gammaproteobacteria bacterium]